jgi:hypothetical protein
MCVCVYVSLSLSLLAYSPAKIATPVVIFVELKKESVNFTLIEKLFLFKVLK